MDWILLVLLGIISGTLAGMLGVGGGVFLVPGLFMIFSYFQFPQEVLMHLALGTSLMIMIGTASTATFLQYRKESILFDVLKKISLPVLLFTVLGALTAHLLESRFLTLLFGIFLALVSLKMLCGFQLPQSGTKRIGLKSFLIIGALIGYKSGILGIGGGTLSVPFLTLCGYPMKKAAGTSVAITLMISTIGTLSFLILGWKSISLPWTTGYIYWPAVLVLMPLTTAFAALGVVLAHRLPNRLLQILFGIILFFISIHMLRQFIHRS
ncbi:MAG: hypothetical protein A2Y28_01015 [Chlamydiae bacterium GWC2_50_10]|nr:MAG: hypothetical protein A2Y28_01015 [Chlamydiae bacterium GWC2_50_10]OGN54818.1 MAG: hypothetical protein A2098_03800 [Chlamydiae bacterium GWF2_49_8]OGN58614.1 MAG: hypothetical protein A3D18_04630 [Chlamydiae bacterium RIFCSPHIGHO2_02_FULL_49_29]OGN63822.1 MAG: hypothetical protein A3E26_00990 [Chlamydiae bacterium RIFCSPHIGHO2_12_FULL_49_32]OGN70255.1 MAG: hypothetical protein A3I15_02465 [Chlamydiae bacterium RIFCSPLOWO2_02_FULL_49_12]